MVLRSFLCCLLLPVLVHGQSSTSAADPNALKAPFHPYCDTRLLKSTRYNTIAFTDFDAGIQCAQKMKRPMVLFFTGINCVNSRKMEQTVLVHPVVKKTLEENYVLIELYCDDKQLLKTSKGYLPKGYAPDATVGQYNIDIETRRYGANFEPYFVICGRSGKKVATQQYTTDTREFLAALKKGLGK